jgi:uncharacterized protein YjiS (DUF1127 family)
MLPIPHRRKQKEDAMAHSLMHTIGSAINRFFERHRVEKTRTELLSLDDHALADIGMSRSDLEFREDPLTLHDVYEDPERMRRPH